jgi:hypothetical protein
VLSTAKQPNKQKPSQVKTITHRFEACLHAFEDQSLMRLSWQHSFSLIISTYIVKGLLFSSWQDIGIGHGKGHFIAPHIETQQSPTRLQAAMRRASVPYYAQAQLATWVTSPGNAKRKHRNTANGRDRGDDDENHYQGSRTTLYYLELTDRERSVAYRSTLSVFSLCPI